MKLLVLAKAVSVFKTYTGSFTVAEDWYLSVSQMTEVVSADALLKIVK